MIAARIKRLVLLVVVLAPVAFGALTLHSYREMLDFQQLIREHTQKQLEKSEFCKNQSAEERRLNYSCSDSATYMDNDSLKMLGEGVLYWRERYELYKELAIYLPLVTLALYFFLKWIWLGRIANEEPDGIQKMLWRHCKSIALTVVVILGIGVLNVLRPERTVEILAKVVVGAVVGVAVVLIMWFRGRNK